MQLERLWHLVLQSLWAPETYLKLLFLAVTSPFWWPLVKAMAREALPVLRDEQDGRPRPPSEDPFLSIPLARYRSTHRARAMAGVQAGGRLAPLVPAERRRGF